MGPSPTLHPPHRASCPNHSPHPFFPQCLQLLCALEQLHFDRQRFEYNRLPQLSRFPMSSHRPPVCGQQPSKTLNAWMSWTHKLPRLPTPGLRGPTLPTSRAGPTPAPPPFPGSSDPAPHLLFLGCLARDPALAPAWMPPTPSSQGHSLHHSDVPTTAPITISTRPAQLSLPSAGV